VKDALGVGCPQRRQNLPADLPGSFLLRGPLRRFVGQSPAGQQLHDDERPAVVLAGIEDPDDVGVGEPAGRSGLGLEPRAQICLGRHVGSKELYRHRPVELGVAPGVDLAHAAGSHKLAQLVAVGDQVGFGGRHHPRIIAQVAGCSTGERVHG
jgi:hypothetical protein